MQSNLRKYTHSLVSATSIIFLVQLTQKVYPLIDNRYISLLGDQALLIHNIYYSFLSIAQYTSYASTTACLIMWNTNNAGINQNQNYIFSAFFNLSLYSTLICIIPIFLGMTFIISHFSVQPNYISIGERYLFLGLILI
ncbi:MAG: hypothetical protein KIT27_10995, partial [Legionellales bacterium]|nr:hypothetical protein [Legionellales bacterium]